MANELSDKAAAAGARTAAGAAAATNFCSAL